MLHQLDEFLPFGGTVPLDDLLAVALLVFFGVRTLQACARRSPCHLPWICERVVVMQAPRS